MLTDTSLSVVADEYLAAAGAPQIHTAPAVRVLHVINGQHYAGAERVQDLLAMALPAHGFEVTFACVKPDRFAALRRSRHAHVISLPMHGRFDLRPAVRLARFIGRHNFRLVHTHTPRSVLIGRAAAMLAGVPVVHHLHSPALADSSRALQNRVNAALERYSLRGIAAVVTVSSSLAGYARAHGIAPRRLAVVPNGVPIAGPLLRRCTPEKTWTLATVALFRPRKGMEALLDAMALLQRQNVPVRLKAVGGFESEGYRQEILTRAQRLQIDHRIDWRGFQKDVTAELAGADLMVLPSLYGEGLPMVVLEAMAAGVPVVATRVEGVPEAIRDGIDGVIAEPGSPGDLAHAIRLVIDGRLDWQSLRASAWQRQAESFSDQSMARGVAEVYRQVLGGNK